MEIQFYNTDCIEFMRTKADNHYDLAIVDPPYGIGAENHAGNKEKGWKQWEKKNWDNQIPNELENKIKTYKNRQ
jgi:site-specific DNA-methyltransferase (adenine-specific)